MKGENYLKLFNLLNILLMTCFCNLLSTSSIESSSSSRGKGSFHNSTSTPNFDGGNYNAHAQDQIGGYQQGFQDQKAAFFAKKQMENASRPESVSFCPILFEFWERNLCSSLFIAQKLA